MAPATPPADELAAVFIRASGLLMSAEKVDTSLRLVTSLAKEIVPASAGAGITLLSPEGRRITTAATGTEVERADALQYELGEGPCLTAWERGSVVRVDDLNREDRWPEWIRAMAGAGLRATLSAPLVAGEETLGALKVYATDPGVYGEREERLLAMFAAQAAILLSAMRTAEDAKRVSDGLRASLRRRDIVNLGKGVIMARDGVDERTAFLTLTGMARENHTALHQAAEHLLRSTTR